MSKDKLTDYDSTASGNLDVGGISVAEGMLPSGVNNAIRELMSHQADAFGAGTPLYVDQTNNRLGIGTSSPGYPLQVNGSSGQLIAALASSGTGYIRVDTSNAGSEAVFWARATNTGNSKIQFGDPDDSDVGWINYEHSNNAMTFRTNASERLRIDSNGRVGIGTDSPSTNLHISSTGIPSLRIQDADGSLYYVQISQATGNTIFDARYGESNGAFIFRGLGGGVADEYMRLSTSGNVGIGTTSPDSGYKLDVAGNVVFGDGGGFDMNVDGTRWQFSLASSEKMRIDSSGNVLVGKTSTSTGPEGVVLGAAGNLTSFNRDSNTVVRVRRETSDGDIAELYKGATKVGSIGTLSDYPYFVGTSNGIRVVNSRIYPCTSTGSTADNAMDLGFTSARYDDIYATNGNIQTSDANEKQQIAPLTDAEMTAAKAISALFKTFKWNDSVAEKGDAARTHTGVIAQDVQAAMTAAGLDASDYAFFISSTWWETQTEVPAVEAVEAVDAVYEDVVIPAVEEELDEDGNVIVEAQPERTEQRLVSEAIEAIEAVDAYTRTDTYETAEEAPEGATERTRLGIRYPELLAFVGAATEQRLANIETRLAALEAN